jgi:hypothetical protein
MTLAGLERLLLMEIKLITPPMPKDREDGDLEDDKTLVSRCSRR